MAKTSASDAAYFMLRFSSEHGDCLTNLKLQKLLYYAQAWHLALYDEPLFDERIEAWVHGPVVPSIYHRFKDYQWRPITQEIPEVSLPGDVTKHLVEVLDAYGGFTGFQLERLTHEEDPWKSARGDLEMDVPSNVEISWDDMKTYYRTFS